MIYRVKVKIQIQISHNDNNENAHGYFEGCLIKETVLVGSLDHCALCSAKSSSIVIHKKVAYSLLRHMSHMLLPTQAHS